MNKEIMFEVAVRNKVRFPYKGMISVEDLWDLSVTALDAVFKTLNSQVKQAKEESLLSTKSKSDERLELQIEIVKYIVSVKLKEQDEREKAAAKKELKQKILQIKADRQDKALTEASDDELQKMLDELNS